ncbi:ATP-binding protein [Kocuria kalidii]|uniref:ATP-binding protein n=1 Tax=Kocuria kalidii TaxID=3376283 RepID=UPI0037982BC5
MSEPTSRRSRRGPATARTVDALHEDLDALWDEAAFVPETDRMAFTLAVVEAAGNVVVHAVPAAEEPIELAVDLAAGAHRLEARIYEIGAAPAQVDLAGSMAPEHLESGRGLALIQALVSRVVFERHGDTNVWKLRREYGRTEEQRPPQDVEEPRDPPATGADVP